jgi:hypothetical protein
MIEQSCIIFSVRKWETNVYNSFAESLRVPTGTHTPNPQFVHRFRRHQPPAAASNHHHHYTIPSPPSFLFLPISSI